MLDLLACVDEAIEKKMGIVSDCGFFMVELDGA